MAESDNWVIVGKPPKSCDIDMHLPPLSLRNGKPESIASTSNRKKSSAFSLGHLLDNTSVKDSDEIASTSNRKKSGAFSLGYFLDNTSVKESDEIVENQYREIRRTHWKKNEDRLYCNNKQCRLKFTTIERRHHCRRCGEIFCNECVKYRRKLNFFAEFDPDGILHKVCQLCFEEGRDSFGKCRSQTEFFRRMKQAKQGKTVTYQGNDSLMRSWRERLDLHEECQRLLEGFMKSVGSSEVKKTLHGMKEMIATPNWLKSTNWLQESMSETCRACSSSFGLLTKKYTCKICGQVLCKGCVKKELLVYIPDDENDNLRTEAKLAIIKVVGSPQVEPEVSLLLHVCSSCRAYMVEQQVERVEEQLKTEANDPSGSFVSKLVETNVDISQLQEKINAHMTKYQEIVESLEDGSKASGDGSNTKVLAKAQDDLSDHFSSLALKIPTLKKLEELCETAQQKKLLKKYTMAKSDFYMGTISTFRRLKKKLSEVAPPEILEYIQKIVDKHAIVSAQVYIRQLIYESIHLDEKHGLRARVRELLKASDDVIEKEADACLQSQGEDLKQHEEHLMEIIKTQLKHHRVVKPSKKLIESEGRLHVACILQKRTVEVLYQVNVQLNMKSIERSFPRTKAELQLAYTAAKQLKTQDLMP